MSAFGPFAGDEEIDFTPLAGRDLLLIEGPTGAGKTSILDAMFFALYGSVPGAREQALDGIRSGFAVPEKLCEVRFDFQLGERLLRIHRVPAQERPKQRGSGTTLHKSEVRLYELGDGKADRGDGKAAPEVERPLAVGDRKVATMVEELLGLSAEQFKQVLLLPQGDFRRFLLAASPEKEKLLEQLFGTPLYKDTAERLRDERKRLEEIAGRARLATDEILRQRGAADSAELLQKIADANTAMSSLTARAAVTAEEAAATIKANTEGQALVGRIAARDAAAAEVTRSEQGRAAAELCRRALDDDGRAAPLRPLVDEEARATQAATKSEKDKALRGKEAGDADDALKRRTAEAQSLPERRLRLQKISEAEGALAGLDAVERELSLATPALASAEKKAQAATRATSDRRTSMEAARRREAELETSIASARRAGEGAAELSAAAEAAEEQARQRRRLAQRIEDAARAAAARGKLVDAAARALAERERLEAQLSAARAARESNLAGELSAHLVDGTPCPVCGATEHPSPSLPHPEAVTREEVAGIEALLDKARRAAERSAGNAAEAEAAARAGDAETQALALALGDAAARPTKEIEAASSSLAERARGARVADEEARVLELSRVALSQKREGDRLLLEAEEAAQRDGERALVEKRAAHAGLVARLREQGLLGEQTVAQRRSALVREREEIEGRVRALVDAERVARERAVTQAELLARAVEEASLRTAAAAAARAALERGAVERGFGDLPSARAALLSDEKRRALAAELEAFERRLSAARARHEHLAAELAGKLAPDIGALAATAEAAQAEARAAQQALGEARTSLLELTRAREEIDRLTAEYGRAADTLRVVGRLAAAVAGDNPLRMSLQRYVLAARMDEVAVTASQRLLRMSRGRYLLHRTDERRGGGGSGLELLVEDRQTGQARSVHSLSGGEMFLASLSLALGLADVVQMRSGGRRLDSLFIDEGFGTLDDETLDQVMRALEDLRVGGRLVGVISHVTELKQRLPVRLSVIKGARGSSTRLTI